jgi:hypothetical protein
VHWTTDLSDCSVVAWGSVPDWVEAIGTSGALLLGLVILRRDHRDRIERQARKVSNWVEINGEPTYHLINSSDQPITHVGLHLLVTCR